MILDEIIRKIIAPELKDIPKGRSVYLTSTLVIGAMLLVICVYAQDQYPFGYLTRDPAYIVHQSGHYSRWFGLLSNIGVLLWTVTAAVCLFVGWELAVTSDGKKKGHFFLAAGILTSLLAIDDLFLLHELLTDTVVGEKVAYISYGIAMAVYLIYFRRFHVVLGPTLLLFGGWMLGLSILSDLMPNQSIAIEDGTKFVGIAGWASYQLRAAWLRELLPETV